MNIARAIRSHEQASIRLSRMKRHKDARKESTRAHVLRVVSEIKRELKAERKVS